jgi:replicative superfamily II helicase
MVDFNKLLNRDASPEPINPSDIFHSLPRSDTKFDYLRDVQGEVLKAWNTRRAERDIVIKMNTGSGKTLVGLLMLQSLLNEGIGPVLYLCPTKQLVEQAYQTAKDIGMPVVTDGTTTELPHEFLNSEAIYVTTFKKLFNGRSVFGIPGSVRPQVSVGGALVDDAHCCLTIARETVTVTLDAASPGYKQIYGLFRSVLAEQCPGKVAELDQGYPWTTMPVPYWAWMDGQQEVAKILAKLRARCRPRPCAGNAAKGPSVKPAAVPSGGRSSLPKDHCEDRTPGPKHAHLGPVAHRSKRHHRFSGGSDQQSRVRRQPLSVRGGMG